MSSSIRSAGEQAQQLVGRRYRCANPFLPERSQIREFARAVQAYHPAHWHEAAAAQMGFEAIVAPPTFAALVWQQARREIFEDLITGYRLDRVIHVDQTLSIGRPLLAGDVLTCDIYFESFRHFQTFDVITVTAVLTDQHGMPVQTGSAALLAGTADAGPVLRRAPDPRLGFAGGLSPVVTAANRHVRQPRTSIDFDQLMVNAELPTWGATITTQDLANYAFVMGDPDPGHITDRFLAADPPALVAPGMLVLALATGYVTSWTRDPAAVSKYWAEFANQVHYLAIPQEGSADIEFNGRVIACDRRRRTATISIDARSQGRKLFGYATAEVGFAPPTPQ